MKIAINDHRKIFAIQEEFNTTFPYLKLEFFSKPHKLGGASPRALVKHNSVTLGECRTIHHKGDITIVPEMAKTAKLVTMLQRSPTYVISYRI